MVWYFHRLALAGVPVNIVIVPLTSLLMPIGIMAALAAYVLAPVAKVLAILSAILLHGILATVNALATLPRADLRLPLPALAVALLCGLTFAFALFALRRSRRLMLAASTALVLSAALLTVPRAPEVHHGVAELTAIDVGQGDSLLLVSPRGHTILIDGGGPPGFARPNAFDVGEDVVSPYLWTRGFSRLDAVVLTHPHTDHMDGLRAVIRNFGPRELWVANDLDVPQTLATATAEVGARVRRIHAREAIELDGLRFTAHLSATPQTENDDSLVLRVEYNGNSALLLGDAERALETEIAREERPVDILKVAHHGSATSTTPELLAATQPKFAVISVGAHNNYGHPRREVLDRLHDAHAQLFRTDESGATTFWLNGKTVAVETYLTPAAQNPRPAGSRDTPR
jgi:competence protein ComEC